MNPAQLTLAATTRHSPLKVYSDASTEHTTGDGAAALGLSVAGWVFCNHNGAVLDTLSEELGTDLDSCQAEAEALRRAVRGLGDVSDVQHVIFYTDWLPAASRLTSPDLFEGFESLSMEWVPRRENQLADMVADTGLRCGTTGAEPMFGFTD